jgi:hypothetical protein
MRTKVKDLTVRKVFDFRFNFEAIQRWPSVAARDQHPS